MNKHCSAVKGYHVTVYKGKIQGFGGSWCSGLGFLIIEDSETHTIESVPCENSSTGRALEAAFENVITPDHTVNGTGHIGKEIFWSCDNLGILEWFIPVKEASDELVLMHKNQKAGAV
ncbi:MAG: hypothetical protein WC614_07610 [bacterium]